MTTVNVQVIEGARESEFKRTSDLAGDNDLSSRTVQNDIKLLIDMRFPQFEGYYGDGILDESQQEAFFLVRKLRVNFKGQRLRDALFQAATESPN